MVFVKKLTDFYNKFNLVYYLNFFALNQVKFLNWLEKELRFNHLNLWRVVDLPPIFYTLTFLVVNGVGLPLLFFSSKLLV
jgi:hypothetical protein